MYVTLIRRNTKMYVTLIRRNTKMYVTVIRINCKLFLSFKFIEFFINLFQVSYSTLSPMFIYYLPFINKNFKTNKMAIITF